MAKARATPIVTLLEWKINIVKRLLDVARKFALKTVNEDYKRNLNKKAKTDDINIIIPSDKF